MGHTPPSFCGEESNWPGRVAPGMNFSPSVGGCTLHLGSIGSLEGECVRPLEHASLPLGLTAPVKVELAPLWLLFALGLPPICIHQTLPFWTQPGRRQVKNNIFYEYIAWCWKDQHCCLPSYIVMWMLVCWYPYQDHSLSASFIGNHFLN